MHRNIYIYIYIFIYIYSQAGKTTTIMRTVVRETGVCRHHGCLIRDTPRTSQHYMVPRGLRGATSITPRVLSLSLTDSWSDLFQSGVFFSINNDKERRRKKGRGVGEEGAGLRSASLSAALAAKNYIGCPRDYRLSGRVEAHLKPRNIIVLWYLWDFRGDPELGPHDAERLKSLGHLHACLIVVVFLFWPPPLFNRGNLYRVRRTKGGEAPASLSFPRGGDSTSGSPESQKVLPNNHHQDI